MKKAFTLPELVITLGIIGVISALVSPALTSIIPDKNKVLVLKSYNALHDTTLKLLDNESLYYSLPTTTLGVNSCLGLGCAYIPLDTNFSDTEKYSGENKYKNLLMYYLSEDSKNFELQDGVTCSVTSKLENINNQTNLISTIEINVPTGKCNDYFSSSCKNPKKYKFNVDTFGNFSPNDALTKAYLETPLKMNNRKKDIARATALLK